MAKQQQAERATFLVRVKPKLATWLSRKASAAGLSRTQLVEKWLESLHDVTDGNSLAWRRRGGISPISDALGWEMVQLLKALGVATEEMEEELARVRRALEVSDE